MPRRPLPEVALATAAAAVVSGAPSTVHALVTGRSPLAAARAAATLLPGRDGRPGLVAGLAVHVAVSAWWGTVLGLTLPRRHTVAWGAAAGAAIAALDLGVLARGKDEIRGLPQLPQWADHVVFGAAVGYGLKCATVTPPW